MHIQEVIIDGFKSYATRTVISGWDVQFNAITGLNGSGKSNILDAICFVLGISNLSHVRASNLQDLVYKQGQAGVTKATVSIVFNNEDTKTSPIGYEHCETITVTRQIIIGGRNKYMINGHLVQASAVQNLFHSVGLNVNNPHFLIMQGRITKVLNMKPAEILGMVEEAAGTRMFEAKKQNALKTIEKKQARVDDISKIIAEDINPTLAKLRKDKADYLRWASNSTEVARLAKFCVAYEYTQAEAAKEAAGAAQTAAAEAGAAAVARAAALRATLAEREAELAAIEAARASGLDADFKAAVAEENEAANAYLRANTELGNRRKGARKEEEARAAAARALAEAEAATAALQAKLTALRGVEAEQRGLAAAARAEREACEARLAATNAGMDAGDDVGGGAGSDGATLADRIMASKKRVDALNAEVATAEMNAKHLRSVVKDLEREVKAAGAEYERLQATAARAAAAAQAKSAALAALRFDPAAEEALRARRDAAAAEVAATADRAEAEWAAVAHQADFQYEVGAMGPGWNRAAVKGVLASLVRVEREDAALALEVGAGGKLWNVVVDTELTGKALLEKGRLRRRVTIVPLNKVKRGALSPRQIEAAASVSRGRAVPALSLVSFPEELRPAMEFAFGSFFVCADAAAAKAVCFHDAVRASCVTLQGDVFDPAGTLEGGASPAAGSVPVLTRLARAAAGMQALEAKRAEAAEADAALRAMRAASTQYAALAQEVELASTEARLATERAAASQSAQAETRRQAKAGELAAAEAAIADCKAGAKAEAARLKELEALSANAAKVREERAAALAAQVEKAKKAAAAAEERARKAAQAADELAVDVETNARERAELAASVTSRDTELADTQAAVAGLEAQAATLKARLEAAQAGLAKAKETLQASDRAAKEVARARDAASRSLEEAESDAKAAEAKAKDAAKEAAGAAKAAADLAASHPWIPEEKHLFGAPHSDYDFRPAAGGDPKGAAKRLAALEKDQADLEKRINKKVIGMMENLEREYADLMSKKDIIEKDKKKIQEVIEELDVKKNEALKKTYAKVNKDFGAIFAMLLPGVAAKLEPEEGKSALDGLEVKVAFNGVWKESLTELSGGQRSLLALSLILALLLFKPAPMYILDEVDAALDLSHTQNIGHMIRTHFSRSQFIIVSLKQGMFANANVVFRTRFQEGVGSTVVRTVSETAATTGGKKVASASGGGAAASGGGSSALVPRKAGGARKAGGGAGGMDDDE